MFEYFKARGNSFTILLLLVFFGLGIYVGFNNRPEIDKVVNILGKETAVETTADFSPFWKVWNDINDKYPNASELDDQNKVYGAISGLVGSLDDPYSVFFKPDEAKLFQEDVMKGSFGGVGMEIGMKDKIVTVIAPLKDTPAYRANIKPGDKILKIDDKVTSDITVDEAIKLIRGDIGTTVTLTTFHDGDREPKEIKIVRSNISIPTLDTELKDGVFVIRLYSFSSTSADLFRNALKEFSTSHTDKLLLDLRGNPGGYLDSAVSMASWFLEGGKIVVTEDYGGNEKPKIYRSQGYNVFNDNLKFVILIDGGSASASEILAGAMQDYKKAILVGEQSYGKGSVQEVVNVTPDTLLKITVAR